MKKTTIKIENLNHLHNLVKDSDALITYFTTPACNVCKVLKPKILQLIKEKYPKIIFADVNSEALPEVAAHYTIFTAPTILVFFDGAETIRTARNISLQEFSTALKRPYSLFFDIL